MPDAKEGAAARSFRLKVEYIEQVAASPAGSRVAVPMNLKQFVAWTDADRGFTAWTSYTVATVNGPYRDLRRRLEAAWATIATAEKSSVGRREGREQSHKLALQEVSALAAQNTILALQKRELTREIERKIEIIEILSGRERELLSLLNKVLPVEKRLKPIAPG